MFAFLRRTKRPDARPLLDAVMIAARRPDLYLSGGVPDTLDGRFELLMLHLFPVFETLVFTTKSPSHQERACHSRESGNPEQGEQAKMQSGIDTLVSWCLGGEPNQNPFAQALYDETFKRLEFGLREMTVGDMGIPHKIRRMMTAYNGRMAAYHDAHVAGDYRAALARNLFGTVPDVTDETLAAWDAYARRLYETIANTGAPALESGQVNWPAWSAQ